MQENQIIDQCIKAWDQRVIQATKLMDSLSEWAMDIEIAPGRNRVGFVLGHLLVVNDRLVEGMELGDRRHADLDSLFLTAQQPDAEYPDAAWIKKNWAQQCLFLSEKFNAMTVADWLSKHAWVTAEDFAIQPERNKLNLLLSRTGHLASHNGQLVLVKKPVEAIQ